jgi:hypothetical protein
MSQPTTSSDRPLPNGLRIVHLTVGQDQESVTLFAPAEASSACCPICPPGQSGTNFLTESGPWSDDGGTAPLVGFYTE